MVSFDTTLEETRLISKIAQRAGVSGADFLDLEMDLTACHANGCPLDLEGLLNAKDFDFLHDIMGIKSNLDRGTGQLLNQFLPRCAKPERG